MQNGRKPPRHFKPGPPPISRPKRWTPNADRVKPNGSGSAQRCYERYIALAQEEARSGNIVAAENYYQHAEHDRYWKEKAADFTKTAEEVLTQRSQSGAAVQYIADYFYWGLGQPKRAFGASPRLAVS